VTTPVSRDEERRTNNPQKRAALEVGWNDVSVVQRLLAFSWDGTGN
jgi:hypothetical protein